jgi:hypothetical protein
MVRALRAKWVAATVLAIAALLIAIAAFSSSPPAAADPSALYADFSGDGKLSCKYSRSDLRAALAGAALSQYGDPYTVGRFKRAVNAQLATGGCARSSESSSLWFTWTAAGVPALIVFSIGVWSARRASSRPRQ